MTGWVEVFRAPVEQNLAPFSRYLHSQGVVVYIFEKSGSQCFCVQSDIDPTRLHQLIDQWNRGEVSAHIESSQNVVADKNLSAPTVFSQWRKYPLTLTLLVLSTLTFFMVSTPWGDSLGGMHWLANMTMQSMTIDGENFSLQAEFPSIDQWWRYWTPIFLHFSWMHILFNGLMLLEIGRRIEIAQGSRCLFFLVMICALASNLTQFFVDPGNIFGGMSGVIYALIGYGWLYQRLKPAAGIDMPAGLMTMMLFWLVLCFSGLITMAGMGEIANAAHVGGLLSGLVLAWLFVKTTSPALPL